MANEYNSEGRLPIHEAAFRNYDTIIDRILADLGSKDARKDSDAEDDRTDEEKERATVIHQARIQELLEATTYDYFRMTPILAATVGNARQTIECLVRHGAKVTSRDGESRSMASIAILKQNVDLFLYFSQQSYANELDLWNTLMTMFTSRLLEEATAAGRMLEQLTSLRHIKQVWIHLNNLRLTEKTLQVFIYTLNQNPHEQLILSCLLILYNLLPVDSSIPAIFSQNEENAKAFIKMKKFNDQYTLLFAHIVCQLCDDERCIHIFVRQRLIGEIQTLLNTDTENLPETQARVYFEILRKIAHCQTEYQTFIQTSSATKRTILELSIQLLERFERYLTISILHFIQGLCLRNEDQQRICADNHLLIAHLMSALDSTYRDVQRKSVDTLQMIVNHNALSQLTIREQGGAEQLLRLLDKATLPALRISIVCTLWSLTGKDPFLRQKMSYAIGVPNLVEFLNTKSSDHLFVVLDAISELLKRVPTENENIPLLFGARHCIPPIVRLLSMDYEKNLLLKTLECIQKLCLLPTHRPCRRNQTIFRKANGFNQLLALIRRSNRDKFIQAKAIATLAYTSFDHKENKEMLTKADLEQLFKRIATLMNSSDETVRAEAGDALATLVCHDEHLYNLSSKHLSLTPECLRDLLSSENISVRCNAAFQMIVLIHLITDQMVPELVAQALLVLFQVIGDPRISDEEKLLPTDLIGRLARMPTGFGMYKHSGVCEAIVASDGLEHLVHLLNSPNKILQGNATVTIDCLCRNSPEAQRRLLHQCRNHAQYLTILHTYIHEASSLKTRIGELYGSMHREPMSANPFSKSRPSRWGHPLVFLASAIGLAGSTAVYYAQIRARQKARNLFLEKSFYDEALDLTRGYPPIVEKLVEPIEPLQIDPTSRFNALSSLNAQVEIPIRGAERAGIVYCYATRDTVDDELFILFLLLTFHPIHCTNWANLDLPHEHSINFFAQNPSFRQQCLEEKDQCPYSSQIETLPSPEQACWGYEPNCTKTPDWIECPGDSRGWTTSKEKQKAEFWRTGDFGYIAEKQAELREFCSPDPSSSLECVDHLRFCRAKNIYIDCRHTETSKHNDRYREDILQLGDIGGHCRLNRTDFIKNGDQKSPLQSWFSELQVFTEVNSTESFHCDLTISKPTILIKLDSGYNMYHHFCDFINLYISQHLNQTFSKDIQIVLWDTSQNDYWSFFSSTWDAFSSNRLIHIKEFEGKRVCFDNVIFSFLARMFYGFYYNMPLVPGCTQTSLFRSFQQYLIHRLRVPQLGPLKSNRIRITLLNRTTQYRQILNVNEIIEHLRNVSNNDYIINVVDYNLNVPFIQQLNITHNSDIFMGMHGAGLTHLLFLPDWATIFEVHNCEDKDCYLDLARLRGVKYFTWENEQKAYPQDEGKHPTLGTPHKKFTNYSFDKHEFARLVRRMVKYVKEHPEYRRAKRMKYSPTNMPINAEHAKIRNEF